MRNNLIKLMAAVLVLALAIPFAGCQPEQPSVDAVVDAAVKAALASANAPATVTFEVDGRRITLEDTQGKTAAQLLEQAQITLQPGDILSLAADQTVTDGITIAVLHRVKVTVVVAGEKPKDDVRYTVVLQGGTVADALAAAGVEVAEGQAVNHPTDTPLTQDMEISVSTKKEEQTTPPASGNGGGGSSYVPSPAPPPAVTVPPVPTEPPAPTEPQRTVVSIEIYEDCDGSGHGVKVITYSDGTQEEVPF